MGHTSPPTHSHDILLEQVKFKKITPMVDICHLQMLGKLLECMLTPENVPVDCPKEWYEIYFVFCCIWAFGGSLFHEQVAFEDFEKTLVIFWWFRTFCCGSVTGLFVAF